METKIKIKVIVPDELRYVFDPDVDPLFVATREKGRILIKPINDYGIGESCHGQETAYRKGFIEGSTSGYEDGYHQGYEDGSHNKEYDDRYKGTSWDASNPLSVDTPCLGNCTSCDFYDDVFDICKLETDSCWN